METASSATLLLLDLPEGALGGIDLLSFTTSPRFQGIKAIPPGIHFTFVGATSSLSLRNGVWFQIIHDQQTALLVKKWDAATETLLRETDHAALMRARANIGHIWNRLTPYRQTAKTTSEEEQEEGGAWKHLSTHITRAALDRILGPTPDHWALNSSSSTLLDRADIAHLGQDSHSYLGLLPVDLRRTWPADATGRDRTIAARDWSWYLSWLIEMHTFTKDAVSELAGELQFTFLMVLTLSNYSCLAQWRRLVSLVLTCKSALITMPEVFVACLAVLEKQMAYMADDAATGDAALFELDDERTGRAWLTGLLTSFRQALCELEQEGEPDDSELQDIREQLDALQGTLTDKFGWRFESSLDGTEQEGGAMSILRTGMLELEDGERVEMDLGTSDEYDRDHEQGDYAPIVVELGA